MLWCLSQLILDVQPPSFLLLIGSLWISLSRKKYQLFYTTRLQRSRKGSGEMQNYLLQSAQFLQEVRAVSNCAEGWGHRSPTSPWNKNRGNTPARIGSAGRVSSRRGVNIITMIHGYFEMIFIYIWYYTFQTCSCYISRLALSNCNHPSEAFDWSEETFSCRGWICFFQAQRAPPALQAGQPGVQKSHLQARG